MTMDRQAEHLAEELFSPLGAIAVRRMFGGAGIYCEGVMFALIADGVIYLKADDATAQAFVAEGSDAFVYEAKGRRVRMSYWRMPDRLLDEPDEAAQWARTALQIAIRTASAKSAPVPRRRSAPRRRG